MDTHRNPVGWFEIYVQDMDRAKRFYETVFECELQSLHTEPFQMWAFSMSMEGYGASGALVKMDGFPSGRNSTRPPLTPEQIKANAETYYRQASLVLDPERTEIRYNSEWSLPLGAMGMIQLAAKYTVARMMERDDFTKRFAAGTPISVHEFLYPMMQGYDSVALKSDLELGGTDQKFNLLMGRHLQAEYGQEAQCILTMPLLEGLDGVDKMSKSKNNYIGITEDANTMFAKVLSISDELMWRYLELLSFESMATIRRWREDIGMGKNPRDVKVLLGREIVARFHGAAQLAERDHGNLKFLGERFQRRGDLGEFLHAIVAART